MAGRGAPGGNGSLAGRFRPTRGGGCGAVLSRLFFLWFRTNSIGAVASRSTVLTQDGSSGRAGACTPDFFQPSWNRKLFPAVHLFRAGVCLVVPARPAAMHGPGARL